MSRRFRWTRERYMKAHHLNRLMQRFNHIPDKPRLVERFHDLIDSTPGMNGTDPLTLPMRIRHWDRFNDSIPF
jgi:hypothetical protein